MMPPKAAVVVGAGGCLTAPLTISGIDEAAVRAAVTEAFAEQRAFPFMPRSDWGAVGVEERHHLVASLRSAAVSAAAPLSSTTALRLQRDAPLMQRLDDAVRLTHETIALLGPGAGEALTQRRFVLIRESPDATCLYEEEAAAVVARVGQGPIGARQPTIYLGLRLFDLIAAEQAGRGGALPEALPLILRLEERAIAPACCFGDPSAW